MQQQKKVSNSVIIYLPLLVLNLFEFLSSAEVKKMIFWRMLVTKIHQLSIVFFPTMDVDELLFLSVCVSLVLKIKYAMIDWIIWARITFL